MTSNNLFEVSRLGWELVTRLPAGYYATNWQMTHGNLYSAIQLSRTLVTILLFSIIAVAAFNIVATLVMGVTDKRSEIAILRTLGLSASGVLRTFLVQGVAIGLVGTLLGAALGIPLAINVEQISGALERAIGLEFMPADVYYIARLPSDLRIPDVVRILCLAFVLCAGSTLYPAYRAARTEPAEALRYDH